MSAIDTIGVFSTQGAASPFPTALAAAPGDSLSIRNYPLSATASIEALLYAAGGNQGCGCSPRTCTTTRPA